MKKEVTHSMSEIGKIEILCDHCQQPMKKLISMPALIGFDDIGRSILKKEATEGAKADDSRKEAPSKPASKEEKAA